MFPRLKAALFALLIVSYVVSACNLTPAEPPPSLQELQLTAQAAAAATLTAQAPTPAEEEPTAMPLPTFTPEPIVIVESAPPPIQPEVVVAAPAEEGQQEQDCGKAVISAGTEGPRAPVSVVNKRGASILLSYYLEPSPFGQCGSGSVNFSGDEKTLSLPLGCYWLYAWVTHKGKDQSFSGYSCVPRKGITWLVFPDRLEEVKD